MKKKKTAGTSYFVHPTAIVEPGARIGPGARIWAFAHVQKGAVVGSQSKIGNYAFVESGVKLGDGVTVKNGVQLYEGVEAENGVFIGPGCVFTNSLLPRAFCKRPKHSWLKGTILKEGCTLGANSTLLCGIEIGRYAFVAAGALVTRSVADFALVLGSPARFHSWRCSCGERLNFQGKTGRCRQCRREYLLEKSNCLRALGNTLVEKNGL